MKTLSRETIIRMTGGATSTVGGEASGGGSVDLSGYALQSWVDENYLSIEFFSKLFKAYNGSTEVQPNNAEATVDNIKAMFGFWTEQYISALGKNSGGGEYDALTVGELYISDGTYTNSIKNSAGDLEIHAGGSGAVIYLENDVVIEDFNLTTMGGNIDTGGGDLKTSGGKLYLDSTRYVHVDNGHLYFYDGTQDNLIV